jgi:murein DD-endopeptidase MepM/ murein hydrolase activator NlpD
MQTRGKMKKSQRNLSQNLSQNLTRDLTLLGLEFILIAIGVLGLSGCGNQNFSAPIDTIHNFGDPAQANLPAPQVSVPPEGNSDEELVKAASSSNTKDQPSQLIVSRRWTYDSPPSSSATKDSATEASPPKFEYKSSSVTKIPVPAIVKGELISDDAGVLKIQANPGEKVKSVAPGAVIYTGPSVQGSGKMVIVKSSEGILFAYSHLQSIAVSEGANVSKGDNLGEASRDPLVFQVRQSGGVLDGKKYIN